MNHMHESTTSTAPETPDAPTDESKILDAHELALAVGGAIVVQPAKPPPPPPPEDYPCC